MADKGKRPWMYQDMFELSMARCEVPRHVRDDIINVLESIGSSFEGSSSDMMSRQRVANLFQNMPTMSKEATHEAE